MEAPVAGVVGWGVGALVVVVVGWGEAALAAVVVGWVGRVVEGAGWEAGVQ